jgi:ParB-like nuclease domain
MHTNTATEYRNLPLAVLTESATNPRRIFEDAALKELAESIRSQGVLSPLLVRPLTDKSFEIVAGARRYRAAQIAEAPTVPVRIVNLTDAEALEAQLMPSRTIRIAPDLTTKATPIVPDDSMSAVFFDRKRRPCPWFRVSPTGEML